MYNELATVKSLIFGEKNFVIEKMTTTDVNDVERFCVTIIRREFVSEFMDNEEYKQALQKFGMFFMFPTEKQRDEVYEAMRMK